MTTATGVALALIVALLGLSVATGEWSKQAEKPAAAAAKPKPKPAADVATIASRVEAIRGLRFKRRPVPAVVTPAQARREGLEDLDRSYPVERRRADEEVLKLLGLLEAKVDLREVSASVFGEGVAGYYDPRTGRLRVVKGVQTTNPALNEITLAHELNHALEDQRFKLGLEEETGNDDADLAKLALIEGTATALMLEYAERHLGPEATLGGFLESAGQDTGSLPPFVEAQLIFPYASGQQFAERLYRTAGNRWAVIDAALRFRPPASTEQVLHPDAYLKVQEPRKVRVDARKALGDGWKRLARGTWGEWATAELLGDASASAGWGGDAYELWQREGGACPAPCTARDALIMRWRWDDAKEQREAETALRAWAAKRRSPVRVATRGGETTLVLAPSAELAARLAREA